MSGRVCDHARRGRVTNQPDGYDPSRPHAATSVCERERCISAAMKWVADKTGEPAHHVPDTAEQALARRAVAS